MPSAALDIRCLLYSVDEIELSRVKLPYTWGWYFLSCLFYLLLQFLFTFPMFLIATFLHESQKSHSDDRLYRMYSIRIYMNVYKDTQKLKVGKMQYCCCFGGFSLVMSGKKFIKAFDLDFQFIFRTQHYGVSRMHLDCV